MLLLFVGNKAAVQKEKRAGEANDADSLSLSLSLSLLGPGKTDDKGEKSSLPLSPGLVRNSKVFLSSFAHSSFLLFLLFFALPRANVPGPCVSCPR